MGITMAPNRKNLSIKYGNKVNAPKHRLQHPVLRKQPMITPSVVVIKEEVGNAVL